MSESVDLLHYREEEMDDFDQDVWDDSMLIRAYNKAVELAKESIAKKMADENHSPSLTKKKGPVNSALDLNQQQTSNEIDEPSKPDLYANKNSFKAMKKSKKSPSPPTTSWREGMHCRAVFSDDGREYEATIKRIQGKTCDVVYVGYNNEECVDISSLKSSRGENARSSQEAESGSANYNSMLGANYTDETFAHPHTRADDLGIIPPPPPPNVMAHFPRDESDALSAMLMSWYMSGYHTGYYQGLTRSKKWQGPPM